MSGKKRRKRRVFRPGAGGAFLRFLIGVVLLVALCVSFYLFVLQGNIPIHLRLNGGEPVPTEPADTAEPEATPTATPVPTIEPTAAPTATPTPAPSATPIPGEALAVPGMLNLALSKQPGEELQLGLKEMSLFDDAGMSVVTVRGYAYIRGRDAAKSDIHLLLIDVVTGQVTSMTDASPTAEDADLSFDADAGDNLDQSFFRANIDVSALTDGYYAVAAAVENNTRVYWSYFDDSMYHFRVSGGDVRLSAG